MYQYLISIQFDSSKPAELNSIVTVLGCGPKPQRCLSIKPYSNVRNAFVGLGQIAAARYIATPLAETGENAPDI